MASEEISKSLAILVLFSVLGLHVERSSAELPASAHEQHQQFLRVMSFNIRFGKAEDGPNHWRHRKEFVLQTVRDFDPDILGTQEMMLLQATFFRERLTVYEFHGTSRIPSDKEEERCAVFYRKARFESLESGHFWLSASPDVPGSKSWDAMFPRMVSWVKLSERSQPEKLLYVFNTHFDHVGKEARIQAAAVLRDRISRIADGSPTIIMGDFNSDEGSLPHRILLAQTDTLGLTDSFQASHPKADRKSSATTSRWNGNRSGRRIDWILASPHWNVDKAGIDYRNFEGRYPSDHYPVTATLSLNESTAASN